VSSGSGQHRPRKRFGQHFLHDQQVIQRIVQYINPQPGQKLVEIGPGLGALTCPLLQSAGRLDVIELDRDVIPRLRETCKELGELVIHESDVLRFDFSQLTGSGETLRVVGNLPYNISTPLLFHVLDYAEHIHDMTFMVQKEVADRLAAAPGSRDYGRLSVMVQYHCQVDPVLIVEPGSFSPPPKVRSAVIRLTPYATPPWPAGDEILFGQIVNQAFSQRRKTIRNGLKKIASGEQLQQAGIDPACRAEVLAVEDFARLANLLSEQKK
jgi:16S rRNA (adenine1518-N6/adenine1519-N6)-dimethyltransferase